MFERQAFRLENYRVFVRRGKLYTYGVRIINGDVYSKIAIWKYMFLLKSIIVFVQVSHIRYLICSMIKLEKFDQ